MSLRSALTGLVVAAASASALARQLPPTLPPFPLPTAPQTTMPKPVTPAPGAPMPNTRAPIYSQAGVIIGQVIDSTSGRGLPRVAVRLHGPAPMQTRLTDDKGRFYFTELPPGDFTIDATRLGYFDGEYGKRRATGRGMPLSLIQGQWVTDVKIDLFRPAVISGFVMDEGNEPVVGARVIATRRELVAGAWRLMPGGSDLTDDRGGYRLFGLVPGDYIVSVPSAELSMPASAVDEFAASGAQGRFADVAKTYLPKTTPASSNSLIDYDADNRNVLVAMPATPPASQGKRTFAYPTQFYPAASAQLHAMMVDVASGEFHPGVNFELRPVATSRVSGIVVGPTGATAGQVLRLLPADADDFGLGSETATSLSASDGTFTFLRVPPGRYVLEAWSLPDPALQTAPVRRLIDTAGGGLWGEATIAVQETDIDSVILTLEHAPSMEGYATFQGTSPRPSAADLARVRVTLHAETRRALPIETRLDGNGEFSFPALLPGRYFVHVASAPPGWSARSVTIDGREAAETPVGLIAGLNTVVISFTDHATRILGLVRDARGLAAPGATIIVMPAAASDGALNPMRTREVRASSVGLYDVTGLPPGEYFIIAIDDAAAEGWQDPGKLAALRSAALRITLRPDEQKGIELKVSPIR